MIPDEVFVRSISKRKKGKRNYFISCLVILIASSFLIYLGQDYSSAQTTPPPPPVALSDSYSGNAARSQSAPGILANDTDPNGNSITVGRGFSINYPVVQPIFTNVQHGQLNLNANGSFTYGPEWGYTGNDSFVYNACNYGACSQATVTLLSANTAPTVNGESYTGRNGRSQEAPGLLANDSDANGDTLTVGRAWTIYGDALPPVVTPPQRGTVGVSANGSFIYTPNQYGDTGNDSFTYRVCDSKGACSEATVNLIAPNSAPQTQGESYNGNAAKKQLAPGLLKNDWEPDQDTMTVGLPWNIYIGAIPGIVTLPQHGVVTTQYDGSFTYNTTGGYAGYDYFIYQVCDPFGACAPAWADLYAFPSDDAENAGEFCASVGEPINVTNGNMWLKQTDYSLPGIGENIEINRFYNSMLQRGGLFGFGWSTKYDESLEFYGDKMIRLNMQDGRALYFGRNNTTSPFISVSPGVFGDIVKNTDNTYTLTFKNKVVHNFNSNGRLNWQKDRNGNQTTLSYSTGSITVTDAFNRVLTISTESDINSPYYGLVKSISDTLGTVATYNYETQNSHSILKTVTNNDGSKYQFEYVDRIIFVDGVNQTYTFLKTVKDGATPVPNVIENHDYDVKGRATLSEKDGGAEKYTVDYNPWNQQIPYTKVTYKKNATDPNIETKYYFDKSKGRNVITKAEGLCGCGGSGSQLTTYDYDNNLNLITETQLISQTSSESVFHISESTYDNFGNRLSVTEKIKNDIVGGPPQITDLGTEKFTYNNLGQVTKYQDKIDSANPTTTYSLINEFDSNGNLKKTTDVSGGVTTITYPTVNKGLPESVIDARQNETKLHWDNKGLLYQIEDPYGKKTTYTYDARGRIETVKNALNNVTTYNYSNNTDRKIEVTYPNWDKVIYKYDVRRLLESITDERNKVTTYTFDNAYRLTKITDPLGHIKEYDYDLMSNLKLFKDGLGNQTDYKYDDFNRLKEIEYPAAETGMTRLKETFEYDLTGRIKKLTDTANRVTEYSYDDANRTHTVKNAQLETTATKYDARGQMIQVTDAKGQIYSFNYDPLTRTQTQTRAGGTMTYKYDAAGNLEKRIDYMARITNYEYDKLNRLTKILYGDPVSANEPPNLQATYIYDEISRLHKATNETGTVTINYDSRNRIKDTTDVFGHLLEYDFTLTSTLNHRKSLKFDGAAYAQYDYDDSNRLTSIINSADSATISFGYDNANRLTSRSYPTSPNGITTTYGYDNMSRLKQIKDSSPEGTLFDRQYHYNTASQIDQISEPTQIRSFGYDNVDRLLSMTNGTTSESYNYDNVGNRTTASHSSASYTYQHDQFNRLISMANSNSTYNYDANGNMVTKAEGKELWRFTWDYENRLTSASTRKQTVRYRYDALGRRVQRYFVGGKENTKFIYDGDDVLVDDNNGTLTKYINGDGTDEKLSQTTGSTVRYFLADHLGSTNALTDASGNITSSASYDSFGNTTDNLNTRYRFTGREYDDFTGLHYYRARWYDSNLGRFISEDPIGLAGGINSYGYVGNNPLGATDSSGLDAEFDQKVWQAQQDLIEALQAPIEFGIGAGDYVTMGISRKIRQWQGIDDPNLDCSVAYQAGQWTAFAIDMATNVGGLVKGAGKFIGRRILKRGLKEAGEEAVELGLKECLRCFEAGTEVQTDEGLKPIEKIAAGDKVLSYNEKTGLLEYREVLQKFTRYADDVYSLQIEGETETLGVTSEHPFFVRTYKARDNLFANDDDGEWKETQNLQVGDEIKLANGTWARVFKVEFKGAGQVYNFTVAGNHNYFVGDLRLLTHNGVCDPTKLPLSTQSQAQKLLVKGATDVKVLTRAEADALRVNNFTGKGYQNTSGLNGNMVRNSLPNGKRGTFHWDYGDTQHGGMPHVQIHDANGNIFKIWFTEGGGIPISPYK
jgi:RHS repeat-associated protein